MKTTGRHFARFRAACRKYLDQFGIDDWFVGFEHGGTEPDELAHVESDLKARNLVFRLAEQWPVKSLPTDREIDDLAKHEVIHALLAPITDLTRVERRVGEEEAHAAEHALVAKLLRLL
jgi:hypothetical protein